MGWKVEQISVYLKWSKQTVREAIHRCKKRGIVGLWDTPRQGSKNKWLPEDISEIEKKLTTNQRAYTARQLCELLAKERKINLSERHRSKNSQKKTTVGKELENP